MAYLLKKLRAAFVELQRRHVVRVAIMYAFVAWGIIQPATTVLPELDMPEWAPTFVIVLTLFGFPIALLLAWAYEATPAGLRGEGEDEESPRIEVPAGSRLEEESAQSGRDSSLMLPVLLVALALCLVFVGGSWMTWRLVRSNVASQSWVETSGKPTVAVRPIKMAGGQEDSDGIWMTQLLILTLSKVEGLSVRLPMAESRPEPSASADSSSGGQQSPDAYLQGTIRQGKEDVAIVVDLSDRNGNVAWTERYVKRQLTVESISAFQEEVARKVAEKLKVEFNLADKKRIQAKPTGDLAAYKDYLEAIYRYDPQMRDLYFTGRHHWNRRTIEEVGKSKRLFEKAIERDPEFAHAYAGLAEAYILLGYLGALPPDDAYGQARDRALVAVRYAKSESPLLGQAFNVLAYVCFAYDRDWEKADNHFSDAIELAPDYPTAYHWYSWYLAAMGRFSEALRKAEIAIQKAESSPILRVNKGWCHYYAGDYVQAISECQAVLEDHPEFVQALVCLGLARAQRGEHDTALKHLEKADGLTDGSFFTRSMLGYGYASAGKADAAEEILSELRGLRHAYEEGGESSDQQYVPAAFLGMIHAGLDQPKEAVRWLGKAFENRSEYVTTLAVEPIYDPVRSVPAFQGLMEKLNFPESAK